MMTYLYIWVVLVSQQSHYVYGGIFSSPKQCHEIARELKLTQYKCIPVSTVEGRGGLDK